MDTSTGTNEMWPLPTNSTDRSAPPAPYPFIGLATGAPTPATSDLPTPLATDITNALPTKRGKGARMRPTKTNTPRYVNHCCAENVYSINVSLYILQSRNLCAQDWVKANPQGTTDDFKFYYSNLSDEQKQVLLCFSTSFSLDIEILLTGLGREVQSCFVTGIILEAASCLCSWDFRVHSCRVSSNKI